MSVSFLTNITHSLITINNNLIANYQFMKQKVGLPGREREILGRKKDFHQETWEKMDTIKGLEVIASHMAR